MLYVHGLINASQVGDLDHKIFTSGYVFKLIGGASNYISKKYAIAPLSTTKVEYMRATHASNKDAWLYTLCSYIGFQ